MEARCNISSISEWVSLIYSVVESVDVGFIHPLKGAVGGLTDVYYKQQSCKYFLNNLFYEWSLRQETTTASNLCAV